MISIVGFEHEGDARRFWDAMRERFEQFGLELHGDKTRLLEFGRYASERRQRRGLGKPETFSFSGLCSSAAGHGAGRFQLQRRTRADRMRARLRAIKDQLRKRMHASIPEQGQVAEVSGHGVLCLSCGAHEHASVTDIPASGDGGVAPNAAPTEPERRDERGNG